jgi:hypothetical protein
MSGARSQFAPRINPRATMAGVRESPTPKRYPGVAAIREVPASKLHLCVAAIWEAPAPPSAICALLPSGRRPPPSTKRHLPFVLRDASYHQARPHRTREYSPRSTFRQLHIDKKPYYCRATRQETKPTRARPSLHCHTARRFPCSSILAHHPTDSIR